MAYFFYQKINCANTKLLIWRQGFLLLVIEGVVNSITNYQTLQPYKIITSMSNLLFHLLLLTPLLSNCAMNLALSGTSSVITFPDSSVSATVLTDQPRSLKGSPNSKWIWNSQGSSLFCDMTIGVSHNFTIQCLNQPIVLYIAADNMFSFQVNGQKGSGSGQDNDYNFTIQTTGLACGKSYTLKINATNQDGFWTIGCALNAAGLVYGLISPDCPACSSGSIFDSCTCVACSSFIAKCQTCTSKTVCTSCANTYYLSNPTTCLLCSLPLPNCLTCSSATNCLTCVSNSYALNGSTCALCSSLMSNCLNCTSKTSCITCSTGFAVSSSACVACSSLIVGCKECSSNSLCTACDTNFVPNYPGCACAVGYVLNGTKCSLCSGYLAGCAACSSSTVCTKCEAGYALNGTKCGVCSGFMAGCTACASTSVCTQCDTTGKFALVSSNCACISGYALSNSVCTECSNFLTGCTACTSATACTTCTIGYALNGASCQTCETSLPHCLTCDSSTNCLSCVSTSYALNGSTCTLCSSLMANCLNCTSKYSCILCSAGFAVSSSTCTSCGSMIVGCKECSSNILCTACDTNFVPNYPGCACAVGYVLNGTKCSLCSGYLAGCAACSSSTVCTKCEAGYALNGTKCGVCSGFMAGCTACASTSVCTQCDTTGKFALVSSNCACISGYALSNSVCTECSNFLTGCTACTSATVCISCSSEYALNGTSCQTCVSSLTGCQTCSSISSCTSCNGTNYIVSSGQCKLCSVFLTGCLNCSSSTICTICDTSNNFVLQSGICKCNSGYAINNSQCKACSAFLNACSTCTSTVDCTSCVDTTYAIKAAMCLKCSSLMVGCLTCTSETVCTGCNTTENFELIGQSCVCASTYTLYSQTCVLCSTFLSNCVTCASSTACSECSTGYALNSSNQCQSCSSFLKGCLECSSNSICTNCNTLNNFQLTNSVCACASGYTLNGTVCKSCSSFLVGCVSCSSTTVCISCLVSDHFTLSSGICACKSGFVLAGASCQNCSTLMVGCTECSSLSTCTSCDTVNNFTLNSSICLCPDGYYLDVSKCAACDPTCLSCRSVPTNCTSCPTGKYLDVGTCKVCSVGCLDCVSALNCTSCDTQFTLLNGKCECSNGTYLNGTECSACSQVCLTCSDFTTCTSCTYTQFRLLNGTNCECNSTNYKQSLTTYPKCQIINQHWCSEQNVWDPLANTCVEKCGDGRLFSLECDDGNSIDGDGCSAVCKVEPNYICKGGNSTTKTVCSYSGPIQLQLSSTIKSPTANTLTFRFTLIPALQSLSFLSNLQSLISTSIPNNGITVSYNNGQLELNVNYTENVQGKNFAVSFAAPGDGSSLFGVENSTIELTVQPQNNVAAVFVDDSVYQDGQKIGKGVQAAQGVALAGLGLGVVFGKAVSVDGVSVLQMAYLSLSEVENLNPLQSGLYNMKYVNGYNKMFENTGISYFSESSSRRLLQTVSQSTNARQLSLGYSSPHFLQNFNYMYIALFSTLLLSIILHVIANYSLNSILNRISAFLKQLSFFLLFFNVPNMGFSFGLQCRYLMFGQNWTTPLYVGWVFTGLSLVMLLGYLVWYMARPAAFKDFTERFKEDRFSQWHYPIMLVCRYVMSVCLAVFNEYPHISYACAGFELLLVVYLIVRRPYANTFFTVAAVINELTLTVFLGMNIVFRNYPTMTNETLMSWAQTSLLFLSILVNTIALIYHISRTCCPSKTTPEQMMREYNDQMSKEKVFNASELALDEKRGDRTEDRAESSSRTKLEVVDLANGTEEESEKQQDPVRKIDLGVKRKRRIARFRFNA